MRRMGGQDAAFLYGETPSWHMHVSAVMIVDPSTAPNGFSVDELKRRTFARLDGAPQFRWRLVEVPFGLDHPYWKDEEVDLDYHVRRVAAPTPGGTRIIHGDYSFHNILIQPGAPKVAAVTVMPFATMGFCSGVLAAFLWALLFRRMPSLKSLSSFSVASGAVALVLQEQLARGGAGLPALVEAGERGGAHTVGVDDGHVDALAGRGKDLP